MASANVLSEGEMRRVLDAISRKSRRRRYATNERNYALLMLLWRTGLRCGEALNLELRDLKVDDDRPTLLVRNGKGGTQRRVGIHRDVIAALADWEQHRPTGTQHVFCTMRGDRLDDSYVRAMLRRAGNRAGVTRVHPHACRATLAVELMIENVPIASLRDVLGHANIAHTDAYLRRVFPSAAIDAVLDR